MDEQFDNRPVIPPSEFLQESEFFEFLKSELGEPLSNFLKELKSWEKNVQSHASNRRTSYIREGARLDTKVSNLIVALHKRLQDCSPKLREKAQTIGRLAEARKIYSNFLPDLTSQPDLHNEALNLITNIQERINLLFQSEDTDQDDERISSLKQAIEVLLSLRLQVSKYKPENITGNEPVKVERPLPKISEQEIRDRLGKLRHMESKFFEICIQILLSNMDVIPGKYKLMRQSYATQVVGILKVIYRDADKDMRILIDSRAEQLKSYYSLAIDMGWLGGQSAPREDDGGNATPPFGDYDSQES